MGCMATMDKKANWILARLSEQELTRLADKMKFVLLKKGEMLYRERERIEFVYFPITASISIRCSLVDGARLQIASVGREGMLGVDSFMSGPEASRDAQVDCEGLACRVSLDDFLQEFERSGLLKSVALGYVMARNAGTNQNAACNRFHTISQQFAKWILTALDRSGGDPICETQDEVAEALGVRRESITAAANHLREKGLINYKRGWLTAVSRGKLESACCECYEAEKALAWRYMGNFRD